ncbi:hypothetical protein NGA35_07265 [Pseudomonas stutzeri]|nr:hypothetical protein [Stutzerimonas stutzeri]
MRTPPPVQPPTAAEVSASTWRQVDSDLLAASREAREQAAEYAEDLMGRWMQLVRQRTDEHFIPWFGSAWTQQWLGMRVTWYQLDTAQAKPPAAERLALYLQDQYQERVLEPVARLISPDWITAQASRLYVQQLGARLQELPLRYGVPAEHFDAHLEHIPAIALAPPASASLREVVRAPSLEGLPAYAGLAERIRNGRDDSGAWTRDAGLAALARQTSTRLADEQNTQGVVGALAAVVGRVAGMAISLGSAAVTSLTREERRPQLEAQLRLNLQAAFEAQWQELLHDPDSGVLAGVRHLSGQIEGALDERLARSLEPAAQPLAAPLQPDTDAAEASYRLW